MRRTPWSLLVAVIVALGCAPAAAHAAAPDDPSGCRDAGGTRAACVGRDKLAERVAAECRRAGPASDEQCHAGVGRRVVREEIDRFTGSWTARVLAFQRRLGRRLPLHAGSWIGTHNSHNDTAEPPTLSHTDSNQQLGLVDQLRLGVRSLEVDAHWIPSPRAGGGFAAVACHGRAGAGCTTERLLGERLAELRPWLEAHPRQVLLLYIEDQIDNAAGYEAAARDVVDALGDERLYRPRGEGCVSLPLDLSVARVRAAGAQVVVVGDCGEGAWQGLSHAWGPDVRVERRPQSYDAYPACGSATEPEGAAGRLVRYFEDSTFLSPAAAPTGASSVDDGLRPETVREMVRCGVNLFGFDQLLPRDGRLDALVWSWADGEPVRAAGGCAVQRPDGRWSREPCAGAPPIRLRAACRSADGGWMVTPRPVRRSLAARRCAALDAALATPRTGADNQRLRDAAGDATVWLRRRG